MTSDMTVVIEPRSDQVNSDDFYSGPQTFTIVGVSIKGGTEQPVSIDIGIPGKVYRPCKSMSRVLVAAWGADAKAYTGRSLTLYRDPKVKWGGMEVGGIRISHMSDIAKPMVLALTETRANRKPYTVQPMKDTPKQQTPAQHPSTPLDDSIDDKTGERGAYADWLSGKVAEFSGEILADFWRRERTTPAWGDLKVGDPERAGVIVASVKEKAGA